VLLDYCKLAIANFKLQIEQTQPARLAKEMVFDGGSI
jgi:hypothetical protein